MKVKANISFTGAVSMAEGDIRDIQSPDILDDLLEHGYVEAVENKREEPTQATEEEPAPEVEKPKRAAAKKGGK